MEEVVDMVVDMVDAVDSGCGILIIQDRCGAAPVRFLLTEVLNHEINVVTTCGGEWE